VTEIHETSGLLAALSKIYCQAGPTSSLYALCVPRDMV
jgi:hypothetical protein